MLGGKIFRQKRGVAIGRQCSAQQQNYIACFANSVCSKQVLNLQHICGSNCHCPPSPLTCTDLRITWGLLRADVALSRVLRVLRRMYALELQAAGEGIVLPSFEAVVHIDACNVQLRIQLKVKEVWSESGKPCQTMPGCTPP